MNEILQEDFSFKSSDAKFESRAAAGAIRALQQKILTLESEKQNTEHHLNYLLSTKHMQSSNRFEEADYIESLNQKIFTLTEQLNILQDKSEFLETELKRKEQQYLIDKDTWALEKKALQQSLEKSRTRTKSPGVKSPKAKKAKTSRTKPRKPIKTIKELNEDPKPTLDVDQLSNSLKRSEMEKLELEQLLHKIRQEYDHNLQLLQEDMRAIKTSSLEEINRLKNDLEYFKSNYYESKRENESLVYEAEGWKNRFNKIRGISEIVKHYEPLKDDFKTSQAANEEKGDQISEEDIRALKEDVNYLSEKYKNLLERTRNREENYPELRSELKNTALELETKLYQLKSYAI